MNSVSGWYYLIPAIIRHLLGYFTFDFAASLNVSMFIEDPSSKGWIFIDKGGSNHDYDIT